MFRVYLRPDVDYPKLAREVSSCDRLVCPACGAELMLELHRDETRRGCWYQATIYCPACGEEA